MSCGGQNMEMIRIGKKKHSQLEEEFLGVPVFSLFIKSDFTGLG